MAPSKTAFSAMLASVSAEWALRTLDMRRSKKDCVAAVSRDSLYCRAAPGRQKTTAHVASVSRLDSRC